MPNAPTDPRITISLPPDLLARLDDLRFSHRIASRAEAVRQLLEVALTVKTKEKG